jgi:hypothetical protein
MRRKPRIHPDFEVVKENIKLLFKDLRNQGFVAKVNFSCCGSCGSYECGEIANKQSKTKIVFYHRQGEDDLKRSGRVYLHHFSTLDTMTPENVECDTKIGQEIVELSKNYPDIVADWNGSADKCILIKRA